MPTESYSGGVYSAHIHYSTHLVGRKRFPVVEAGELEYPRGAKNPRVHYALRALVGPRAFRELQIRRIKILLYYAPVVKNN